MDINDSSLPIKSNNWDLKDPCQIAVCMGASETEPS